MRTPLSAILGFSDLMRNEPRDGDATETGARYFLSKPYAPSELVGLVSRTLAGG